MTHDVVICTRNRPSDLATALASLGAQTVAPSGLIIVDASDNDESEAVVGRWSAEQNLPFEVIHIRAEPGLPAQRNLGVNATDADVVHFIDDDVVLDPEYVAAIAAVFEEDTDGLVVGVGGLITNQPVRRPRLWWRLALMDSTRSGVVLRSGTAIIVTAAREQTRVQWLSGCSMSYRAEVVRQIRFDEALPGYALMEDTDFSFRARRAGELVLEPRARLVHNVSPTERWDHRSRHRAATYRRGWFVSKNLPRWCVVPFWWSVAAGAVVQCFVAIAEHNRWGLRVAVWRLEGGIDYLRGRR